MHPVFVMLFEDMDPVKKTKDGECRLLAVSFLDDIARSRNVTVEEHVGDLARDFGFFDAEGHTLQDPPLHHSMITGYVRERFMDKMDGEGGASEEAGEITTCDGEPLKNHRRRTQPDADIREAKYVC
jgi:hypothetical protein